MEQVTNLLLQKIIPPILPLETCPRMILSGKGGWGGFEAFLGQADNYNEVRLGF